MKNKFHKPVNKEKKGTKLIMILIALIILLIVIINVKKTITTNAIKKEQKEQQAYEEWLVENCECIERERILCPKGFELKDNLCKNETKKIFTNVLAACSKYNCSEEIHIFNSEEEKWQKNQN